MEITKRHYLCVWWACGIINGAVRTCFAKNKREKDVECADQTILNKLKNDQALIKITQE